MVKALSVDLRKRVVAAVDGGLSRNQAAQRFGVSIASAVRWCSLQRQKGDVKPCRKAATTGRRGLKLRLMSSWRRSSCSPTSRLLSYRPF